MWLAISMLFLAGVNAEILDGVVNIEDKWEPMIAFMCGRATMYRTSFGWQADQNQDCLTSPSEIVTYCAMKFPRMNITNVIPASNEMAIANWDSLAGDFGALETFTVRPFRCIDDKFDSDALMVPDGCDYQVESMPPNPVCQSYFAWNTTAQGRCNNSGLALYAFSVLSPCGPGAFSAVEFVCCPAVSSQTPISTNSAQQDVTDEYVDDDEYVDYAYNYNYDDSNEDVYADWYADGDYNEFADDDDDEAEAEDQEEEEPVEYNYEDVIYEGFAEDGSLDDMYEYETEDDYDPTKNYYVIYMDTPEQLGATEHEAYTKALQNVKRYYDDEKQKLMQQLADIEQRAEELQLKNVTLADQIRNDGIATIRELYDTTHQTWLQVKAVMTEEHQYRVETSLENSRLDREESFDIALEDAKDLDDVAALNGLMRALEKYVRIEEKERIHWINRYEHLLDTDPSEAERIRLTVQEMLRQIQQRLDSVADSLKRVPRLDQVIRARLSEFLRSYEDVDQEVKLLFPDLNLFTRLPQLQATVVPLSADEYDPIPYGGESISSVPQASDLLDHQVEEPKPLWFFIVIGAAAIFTFSLFTVLLMCCIRKCCFAPQHRTKRSRSPDCKPSPLDFRPIIIGVNSPRSPLHSFLSRNAPIHVHENPLDARININDRAVLVEQDSLNEQSS